MHELKWLSEHPRFYYGSNFHQWMGLEKSDNVISSDNLHLMLSDKTALVSPLVVELGLKYSSQIQSLSIKYREDDHDFSITSAGQTSF